MQKNYLIIMLLSISITLGTAQVKSSHSTSKFGNVSTLKSIAKPESEKMSAVQAVATICNDKCVASTFNSISSAMKANQAANAALTAGYARPAGTMFEGYTRNFYAYAASRLHSPAKVAIDYKPYASDNSAVFTWKYNGGDSVAITDNIDTDGTLHFTSSITPIGYISYLPRVTATTATEKISFVVGKGVSSQYLLSSSVDKQATEDGTEFQGINEFAPLTLANMYARKPTSGNLYTGYNAGGSYSPYYSNDKGACVGIMQIIPQLKSPLYIETISALVYDNSGLAVVPTGGVLKLQLRYVNQDGTLGDLIAESSTKEFVNTYTSGTTVEGAFIFKFQAEEDGFVVDKPVTLGTKAPVAVVITGFDSTWHFKFLFGSNPNIGSTYTLHGADLAPSTFGYTNAPTIPSADVYIQFNGIFNCLTPTNSEVSVTCPVEGGYGITGYNEDGSAYNDVDLYSAYNFDDNFTNVWIESTPDWITDIETDTTYFGDYKVLMVFAKAGALPEGVSGRSGEIVISSYGVSAKIPVKQGTVTGVKNEHVSTVKVAKTANTFEISNANDYNSVSLINTAGQILNKYKLSASKASIPTSSLSKGIYILRLEGNRTETIKVIK